MPRAAKCVLEDVLEGILGGLPAPIDLFKPARSGLKDGGMRPPGRYWGHPQTRPLAIRGGPCV